MNPRLFKLIISIMFILFIFTLLTCIIIEIIKGNNVVTVTMITTLFTPIISRICNNK